MTLKEALKILDNAPDQIPTADERNTATKYIEPRIQKTTQSHKNLPRAIKTR